MAGLLVQSRLIGLHLYELTSSYEVESERTNVKLPRYNPRMVTGEFSFLVAPPLHQNNKIVLGND